MFGFSQAIRFVGVSGMVTLRLVANAAAQVEFAYDVRPILLECLGKADIAVRGAGDGAGRPFSEGSY